MSGPFLEQTTSHTLSIVSLTSSELKQWREQASQRENDWLDATRFEASPGSHCVIPDDQGSAGRVLAGRADGDWLWSIAGLSRALGEVSCSLDNAPDAASAHMAALGFGLAPTPSTTTKNRAVRRRNWYYRQVLTWTASGLRWRRSISLVTSSTRRQTT